MKSHYERLSALDATFLDVESDTAPMHVGAVLVFDAKPLQLEHGGLDVDRVVRYMRSCLDKIPRYRQRVAWIPGFRHPVWVDDDHFNILYHLRHTRLPLPGTDRMLKRLAGRLFSQRLDRSRPLWEFWLVEGLEGDRFALVCKAHHCMVDGMAGVELVQALMRLTADPTCPDAQPWQPRPVPSRIELLRSEVRHRATSLPKVVERLKELREHARGMSSVLRSGLRPAPRTPFTERDVSPYRRFDWMEFELDDVKAIKKKLGGTVNDVVVTIVTDAVRRFLIRRGVDANTIRNFKVVLPVSIRTDKDGAGGNRVAMLLANLPVSEPDPLERLRQVIEVTTELKTESDQAGGARVIEELADLTTKELVSQLFKTAMRVRTYNLIVTNVPGPPFPLYMLGAKMQAMYPMVPLMQNQNLGIALFSYFGKIFFGLNADWQSFPDVHEFMDDMAAAYGDLKELASLRSAQAQVTA